MMDLRMEDIVTVQPMPEPAGPIFMNPVARPMEALKIEVTPDTPEQVQERIEASRRSLARQAERDGAPHWYRRIEKTEHPGFLPGMAVREKVTGQIGIVVECFWRGKVLKIRPDDGGMYVAKVWWLNWVARNPPILVLMEGAAENLERIVLDDGEFEIRPGTPGNPKGKLVPGGL